MVNAGIKLTTWALLALSPLLPNSGNIFFHYMNRLQTPKYLMLYVCILVFHHYPYEKTTSEVNIVTIWQCEAQNFR